MKALQKQRIYNSQRDVYYRKVERENLDGYGWTMSLDTVRTPEEILLVRQRFERLEARIARLPPRIERVIRLRLGINCKPHTLAEIGEQYGVQKERIRQLEGQGMRALHRWSFIEEKPEQYRRERDVVAKAYKERLELERQHAAAEAAERQRRHDAPAVAAMEAVARRHEPQRPADSKYAPSPYARMSLPSLHKRTILDDIVREQRRALALEREYRGWAGGRERKLLPADVLHGMPYAYRMRRVEPKPQEPKPQVARDWLHVATEGFKHGA